MPSPWVILGFLITLIFGVAGSFLTGKHTEHNAVMAQWQAADLRKAVTDGAILSAAEKRAHDAENRFKDLATETEAKAHEADQKINDSEKRARAAIAADGGLRDVAAHCVASSRDGVPATPVIAADATNAAPGVAAGAILSGRFTEFLVSRAVLADKMTAYANTCHDWVADVSREAK